MENSKNLKSLVLGIDDLSKDQNQILSIDKVEREKFHKRLFVFAIGLLIAIISFCITYADLFQF